MVEWPGYRSCLTMLLYLNGKEEGVEGGSTRLYRRERTWFDVEPIKGSALFFAMDMGQSPLCMKGAVSPAQFQNRLLE